MQTWNLPPTTAAIVTKRARLFLVTVLSENTDSSTRRTWTRTLKLSVVIVIFNFMAKIYSFLCCTGLSALLRPFANSMPRIQELSYNRENDTYHVVAHSGPLKIADHFFKLGVETDFVNIGGRSRVKVCMLVILSADIYCSSLISVLKIIQTTLESDDKMVVVERWDGCKQPITSKSFVDLNGNMKVV